MAARSDGISRRHLLTLVVPGALSAFGASGCKRAPVVCADVSALDAQALAARSALGYLDTSGDPAKTCERCQQYIPAAEQCGECKVLKGPIRSLGTCRAFVAR